MDALVSKVKCLFQLEIFNPVGEKRLLNSLLLFTLINNLKVWSGDWALVAEWIPVIFTSFNGAHLGINFAFTWTLLSNTLIQNNGRLNGKTLFGNIIPITVPRRQMQDCGNDYQPLWEKEEINLPHSHLGDAVQRTRQSGTCIHESTSKM